MADEIQDELREMIRSELAQVHQPSAVHIQEVVRTAVQETLITMGMDASDRLGLQKDMAFIRELRETSEKVKARGLFVLVGLLVTALCTAIWLGIKASLNP